MGKIKTTKQKLAERQQEIKKKINSIEFDTHWFRRVFHTFAAFFLIYYMLPIESWTYVFKIVLSLAIVLFVFILECLRLKGKISSSHFFGLRIYEKNRPASYLYFGIAILILLLFFPQPIAIPCILCACLFDPIIGELRHRLGKMEAYAIGFFVCMLFFAVAWYKADLWIMFFISIVGASGALIGEAKRFWLIDDDFMVQMLPAVLILLIWIGMKANGVDIMPDVIIHPI